MLKRALTSSTRSSQQASGGFSHSVQNFVGGELSNSSNSLLNKRTLEAKLKVDAIIEEHPFATIRSIQYFWYTNQEPPGYIAGRNVTVGRPGDSLFNALDCSFDQYFLLIEYAEANDATFFSKYMRVCFLPSSHTCAEGVNIEKALVKSDFLRSSPPDLFVMDADVCQILGNVLYLRSLSDILQSLLHMHFSRFTYNSQHFASVVYTRLSGKPLHLAVGNKHGGNTIIELQEFGQLSHRLLPENPLVLRRLHHVLENSQRSIFASPAQADFEFSGAAIWVCYEKNPGENRPRWTWTPYRNAEAWFPVSSHIISSGPMASPNPINSADLIRLLNAFNADPQPTVHYRPPIFLGVPVIPPQPVVLQPPVLLEEELPIEVVPPLAALLQEGGEQLPQEANNVVPLVDAVEEPVAEPPLAPHTLDGVDTACAVCLVEFGQVDPFTMQLCIQMTMLPCNHANTCGNCIALLHAPQVCPMCRAVIEETVIYVENG